VLTDGSMNADWVTQNCIEVAAQHWATHTAATSDVVTKAAGQRS